jgi:RecJ-like exonuclease
MLTFDTQVRVREECQECHGKGVTKPRAWCTLCGQPYTGGDGDMMPCGHPWIHLHEEDICTDCEGTGFFERWATLREVFDAPLS